MDPILKKYVSPLIHAASKDLQVPFLLACLVRIISFFQILSLVLLDSILSPQHTESSLARSLGSFISNMKDIIMFPEIKNEATLTVVAYLCYTYVFLQFAMILYFILLIHFEIKPRPWISKTIAFVRFIHSQVLFYPLHCFFLRQIDSHLYCNEQAKTTFYCDSQWLILPCIFGVFNFGFAFTRELFCHQAHDQKEAYSIKDNLYSVIIFAQKTLIVPLLYFLDNPDKTVIALNILFCLAGQYILHSRLSFYHLNLLRLEIGINSNALTCAFLMTSQGSSYHGDFLLIMILAIPLVTKLSLIYHDFILQRILKATKFTDPFQAVHLPKLLSEYFKQIKKPASSNMFSKATIYVSGLLTGHLEGVPDLELKGVPKEVKKQAYTGAKTILEALSKTRPHNLLLLICLARIYIKKLKDYPKAVSLINELRTRKLGIAMRNSVEDLYLQLEEIYSKTHANSSDNLEFLHYFEYRDRTTRLKNMIRDEITQQIKVWETLNENSVSADKVISQAEKIDSRRKRIEALWHKEIQSLEKIYVGAPLLYGLYLDVVQGLTYFGRPLIKKAYKIILNKGALHREIMDIFIENSACIIASNEPEKTGKIVDASSSVKQLFEISKEHLLGSNINVLLPKVMNEQMIKNFSSNDTNGLGSTFTSYAKTLADKYFSVKITIHAFPSIKLGLNHAVYITKTSDSIPLMIVDYYGRVIECSKDVQKSLNSGSREGYLDLAKICPELVSVNQAFNIMYAPEEQQSAQQPQNEVRIFSESDSTNRLLKSPTAKYEENLLSVSDVLSTRELLIKPIKDNEATIKTDLMTEKNPSSPKETKDKSVGFFRKMSNINGNFFQNTMSPEEAEKICNQYTEKKRMTFHLPSSDKNSKKTREAIFETQIEPVVLAGSLYKIIKVKKLEQVRKKTIPITEILNAKEDQEKAIVDIIHSDAKAISFQKISLDAAKGDIDDIFETDFDIKMEPLNAVSEKEEEEVDDHIIDLDINPAKTHSRKSKAASLIGSTKSGRSSASRLNNFLRTPKLSYATKAAIILVFISFLIVLISVCIDVIFTQQSLQDIEDAVGLINLTNIRLFRLIAAWRGALIVYSRSVAVRPNNAALVVQYRGVVKNSTKDMLNNNNMLQARVDDFRNELVTRKFFDRKVSLWVPYKNATAYGDKVDTFTASQIISVNNMYIANWGGAVTALKNRTEVIFALNNTANDYLVAVSDSISEVVQFFEDTQKSNNNLLEVIIILENLALVIPFLSLRALFKIVVNSHRDLFKVVSKIPRKSIQDRLKQLNKVNDYLKENVEDSLLSYQAYVSPNPTSLKQQAKADKKNDMSRTYTLKGMIWNMLKYLAFTFVLVSVILVLFWLSYTNSIQGFNDLRRINNQLVTTYEYGSQISLILSNYYFVLNFFNQSAFKIRNDNPIRQMNISIDYLTKANEKLLEVLSLSDGGIEDPEIEGLLKNNLCQFMPSSEDAKLCRTQTTNNSFGLLGLNFKFYTTCGIPILNYLGKTNLTLAAGIKVLDVIVGVLGDMHVLAIDSYEALGNIIYANFEASVEEKKTSTFNHFKWILVAIFISVFLIGVVVIRKYQQLELSVYKILRLIPYEVIEKNKAFNFYLSRKFASELAGFNSFM